MAAEAEVILEIIAVRRYDLVSAGETVEEKCDGGRGGGYS